MRKFVRGGVRDHGRGAFGCERPGGAAHPGRERAVRGPRHANGEGGAHAAATPDRRREGLQVTWNRFGTPQTLSVTSGSVATGLSEGTGGGGARSGSRANRTLLGIGAAGCSW